jgi:hypothetical protein
MNNNINLPEIVLRAFPVLTDAIYIRRLAALVPLVPDTTFDIFMLDSGKIITLVSTDYADPRYQSMELKNASGNYQFEFMNLIKPYRKTNDTLKILDHDDMVDNFLVNENTTYYYIANTKYDPNT